jgi:hypothetical protein
MSKPNVAVAAKKGTVLLPVAELRKTFFVRRETNADRVLYFMELFESDAAVPPIKVVRGSMAVYDGRHRLEALEHLERKHAVCELVEPGELSDMLIGAFGENFGGALPPTRADTVFVMMQLIEAGTPNARIKSYFSPDYFRPSHADKLLKDAHSRVSEAKMKRAVNAVVHTDATAPQAAEEHGVKLEDLKAKLSGTKRKGRGTDIGEIKSEISNRNKGNGNRTAAILRDLLDKFQDGEISEKKVSEVIDHIERLYKQASARVKTWRERLEAMKGKAKAKS